MSTGNWDDFFAIGNWPMLSERCCIVGPECPTCHYQMPAGIYRPEHRNPYCCPRCLTVFGIRTRPSPLGLAYATRVMPVAYAIDVERSSPICLMIVDVSEQFNTRTVSNGAEEVVRDLFLLGELAGDRPLFYRDTMGRIDRILHAGGSFFGFSPGADRIIPGERP